MKISLLAFSLLFASSLLGEDLSISDGTIFKNVSVASSTAAYVNISHDDGTARIRMQDLPQEWQTKYGFDVRRANQEVAAENLAIRNKESAKHRELSIQERHDAVAEFQEEITANIIQILDGGILIQNVHAKPQYISYPDKIAVPNIPGGRHTHLVKVKKTVRLKDKIVVGNVIFVQGVTATRVDQPYSGTLWHIGTYDYKNLVGEHKSVNKYTTSREEAETYHFGPLP